MKYFSQKDLLNIFELNAGIVRLISFFFSMTLIVHLMACIWNYISIVEMDDPVKLNHYE
jgi:hypothetical protein